MLLNCVRVCEWHELQPTVEPSFRMIAHDRRITENTASDRQRRGNTFPRLGYRQRLYGNTFQRSSAILRFSDSNDPAIVNDHVETRPYTVEQTTGQFACDVRVLCET